jgi:endonuclease/exonuclease/phosphatase family metal-dependent hydrolase
VVVAIFAHDSVLCMGDFNAQAGSNAWGWEGVLGGFSQPSTVSPPTNIGMRLLSSCLSYRLSMATSYFAQLACRQATFIHQNVAAHNTMIDHILVL